MKFNKTYLFKRTKMTKLRREVIFSYSSDDLLGCSQNSKKNILQKLLLSKS